MISRSSPRPSRRAALGALALAAAAGRARAAGKEPAPSAIISFDELRERMKKNRGRSLVLHFWATWCAPCLEELPLVNTLVKEARARGIDILSVSLDDPTERAAAYVGKVLAERGAVAMTSTILKVEDADTFIANIDKNWEGTIPAFFAYDRGGNLRRAFMGEMTREHFDKFTRDLGLPVKK